MKVNIMHKHWIKLVGIVCILLLISNKTQAQKAISLDSKNKLSLALGYDHSYFKDLNFSPFNYTAQGVVINLGYMHRNTKKDLFFSEINFSYSSLQTKASDVFTTDRYLLNLEIGYLKHLPLRSEKWEWYLGGQYHTYLDLAFWQGIEAFTFFAIHSIDLSTALSYEINERQAVETAFSLPIFGLLVRPPYIGYDVYIADHVYNPVPVFFRGKWASLNRFFGVNWDLKYTYALSQKWDLVGQFRYRLYATQTLYETNQTAQVTAVTNQLTIGTNFKF